MSLASLRVTLTIITSMVRLIDFIANSNKMIIFVNMLSILDMMSFRNMNCLWVDDAALAGAR